MLLSNPKRKSRRRTRARRLRRSRRRVRRQMTAQAAPARRRRRRRSAARIASSRPVRRIRRTRRIRHMRIRRRSRARRYGRNNLVRELVSRETLLLTGGAISANVLNAVVMSRLGNMLPGLNTNNAMALTAYTVGIPVLGAYLARRWNPIFAKGLVIGAAASGIQLLAGGAINSLVNSLSGNTGTTTTTNSSGTQAYLPRPPGSQAYLNVPPAPMPGPLSRLTDAPSAFKSNAWS